MLLKTLVSNIRRDNKISSDEIISRLIEHIQEMADLYEDCNYREVMAELYKKAYGNVLTKELADNWVKSFPVTDGSDRENGIKWNMEATTEVGNKVGIDWSKMSKVDWFVVMNMEYYKHYDTAKAYGDENDPVWFAHIAKDEWCDPKTSLFNYYAENVL